MRHFENIVYISGIEFDHASNGAVTRLNFMASGLVGTTLIVSFERLQIFQALLNLLFCKIEKRDENLFTLKLPYFPLLWVRIFIVSRLYYNFVSLLLNFKFKPQIVQVEMFHFAGVISSKFCKTFICDIHGDYRSESGFSENTKEYSLISRLNCLAIAKSHKLIVVSDKLKENLMRDYGISIETAVIPCLPSATFLASSVETEIEALEELVFCYVGGIQKYQEIALMLSLVLEVSKLRKCRFVFISGSSLSETCRVYGIDYYQFSRFVDFEEYRSVDNLQIPQLLRSCDFGFLLRSNTRLNTEASPTKLREYFANGVKVITTQYAGDVGLFPSHWLIYVELDNPIRTAKILAEQYKSSYQKLTVRKNIKDEFHGV